MKFIGIGDIHSTSYPPAARLDNYIDELFDLLGQVTQLAVAVKASAVLLPGDLFHSKEKSTVEAVMRLMVWGLTLRDCGIRVLAIPGNHDEVKNRYESVAQQPLGWLFASGVFENVSTTRDERPASFIQGEERVAVWGIPWPDSQKREVWDQLAEHLQGDERSPYFRNILLAHCFAAPIAGSYYGDPIWAFADLARTNHDLYLFAHDHRDNGAFELPSGQQFVNYGAICRTAANPDDLIRQVAVALIDVFPDAPAQGVSEVRLRERIRVQRVNLNARPAVELFDLAKKAQIREERATIERFVEALHSVDLQPLDAPEVVKAMGLAAEVERRVLGYLEASE